MIQIIRDSKIDFCLLPVLGPWLTLRPPTIILKFSFFSYVRKSDVFERQHRAEGKKKTNVQCDTIEPFYNETFHINATSDDLPACSLLLSVYQTTGSDATTDDKLIGRVLLGGMMYARKELEHWTDMLSQPRTMVKYWHSLGK